VRRSCSFARLRVAAGQNRHRLTHACRLDDPLIWGVLPARTYFNSHLTRWSLGASDIIFTNPYGPSYPSSSCTHSRSRSVFSAFFRKGQVLETFRGVGIYQPAIDTAIEKLRAGAWVRSN
jgi:monolysocardiolipin acyltransferase